MAQQASIGTKSFFNALRAYEQSLVDANKWAIKRRHKMLTA